MEIENTESRIRWIILAIAIIVMGAYFIFLVNLNFIKLLIILISFALAIVFVFGKIFNGYTWKIPCVSIGLELIRHLYTTIRLYYSLNYQTEPIYHTSFLQALQYTYGGDNGIFFVWIEIPFILLTILITIAFYLFSRINVNKK